MDLLDFYSVVEKVDFNSTLFFFLQEHIAFTKVKKNFWDVFSNLRLTYPNNYDFTSHDYETITFRYFKLLQN